MRDFMEDLKVIDDLTIKHGSAQKALKPKYLRGLKDLDRVVEQGKAFAYRVINENEDSIVYEVLVFIGSISGSKNDPGIYVGFKIKYSKTKKKLNPIAASCFCYDDGLDETPIIKNLSQAKSYMESKFPLTYTVINN